MGTISDLQNEKVLKMFELKISAIKIHQPKEEKKRKEDEIYSSQVHTCNGVAESVKLCD